MRTSTKIYLILFIVTAIISALFFSSTLAGIIVVNGFITFNFDAKGIVGLVFNILSNIFFTIIFIRFLNSLKLSRQLFFMTVPVTLLFATGIYFVSNINTYNNEVVGVVKRVLNISSGNSNNIWWAILLTVIYLLVLFFSFWLVCKPIRKVENAALRLSDGRVKDEIIIGGSRQFRDIEYALNKINYNYKEKENLVKKTNLEAVKFIPKEFLKFLGKSSITELELGNQVQREVTTMFCDIKSSTIMSKTLSLEENFNFINSYLNVVAPIIRRYGGFVDKYLGDGVLAVFTKAENAVECSGAIVKAINLKNNMQKELPTMDVRISIHTGEVVFGVVGDEERKSPTIISDAVNLASKMEDVNKFLGTKVIFSKRTLNSLEAKYPIGYRYIGSLSLEDKSELAVFEYLDVYNKKEREKLIDNKSLFERGVREYNEGKYKESKEIFSNILKSFKNDNVAYVYFNKASEKLTLAH